MALRLIDVTDEASFGWIPPCADASFDHRTCDYWEDAARGSRAARSSWLEASPVEPRPSTPSRSVNPFAPEPDASAAAPNPFVPAAVDLADNPFAPRREARPTTGPAGPRKLGLLGRGLAVFGSYAKVAMDGDVAVAYAQFGPLSAYPRALQIRELYPQLPQSPLPAVITCIATTGEARRRGHARALVEAVCVDLAGRGFSAVEAYPEAGTAPDATSAASVGFWKRCGFEVVIEDGRFPVMRRELE
jgi:ribosomal protein S18 acetylase RimI-like enzyme